MPWGLDYVFPPSYSQHTQLKYLTYQIRFMLFSRLRLFKCVLMCLLVMGSECLCTPPPSHQVIMSVPV